MARYECERCHMICFTTNPPHLCKDVAVRYARRVRQADVVESILREHFVDAQDFRGAAEDIVTALVRLGVSDD